MQIVGGTPTLQTARVASASHRRLKFVTLRVLCGILCVSEIAHPYILCFFSEVTNIRRRRDADATNALRVASASRRRFATLETSVGIILL